MQQPPIPPGYVAYPRSRGPGQLGPGPRRVRFDSIAEAWALLTRDIGTWLACMLIVVAAVIAVYVPFIVMMVPKVMEAQGRDPFQNSSDVIGITIAMTFALQLTMGLLSAGILRVALLKARGEYAVVGDMFRFNGMFGQVLIGEFLMALLYLVPVGMSLIPLATATKGSDPLTLSFSQFGLQMVGYVIIGIVQTLAAFVPLTIIDQQKPMAEAFKISFSTLRRHFWAMAALLIIASIIGGIGAVACGIGILFTMPLYYCIKAIVYNDFFRPEDAPSAWDPVPQMEPL